MATSGVSPRPRRHWIAAALTEHLLTKLLALALAILIWAVVRSEETTEVVLTVPVVLILDPSLQFDGRVPDSVQVVVTGRMREVLKLRASPPVVRRRFDEETPRRMRVTLVPADVEFPVGVQATARDVRPASFTLALRPRTATPDGAR